MSDSPTPEPEPTEARREPTPSAPKEALRPTRTSGAWTAVIVAAVLLVLLIVFIVQNTDDVRISFLGWDGSAPLAVALLVAAVAGVLITAVVGSLRILQLRRRIRRDLH